jgi:hypothetical protein
MLLNPHPLFFSILQEEESLLLHSLKPSVVVSLVTCFEIPFKAFNPPEILSQCRPSVGTDSSPASQRNQKKIPLLKSKIFSCSSLYYLLR